jgi:hypothetical protein
MDDALCLKLYQLSSCVYIGSKGKRKMVFIKKRKKEEDDNGKGG